MSIEIAPYTTISPPEEEATPDHEDTKYTLASLIFART